MTNLVGQSLLALLLVAWALGCQPRSEPAAEATCAGVARQPWWTSPGACLESLRSDPPRRDDSRVRLGSWNVRYFPDGAHGEHDLYGGVDVAWLACAVARLDPDVLAVQEFKAGERLQPALSSLLELLREHTGDTWTFPSAQCGADGDSHVGLLVNTARATLNAVRELPELLLGQGCNDDLQPLLLADLDFAAGPELRLGVLHLVAGDRDLRARTRDAQRRVLGPLVEAIRGSDRTRDLVLTGDWNSSGCVANCPALLSAAGERSWLSQRLERDLGLRLVPASIDCSVYYRGQPGLVDHFAVSTSLGLPEATLAVVEGYCVEARCQSDVDESDAFRKLSDHCPLLLDIPAPKLR